MYYIRVLYITTQLKYSKSHRLYHLGPYTPKNQVKG